MNEDKKEFWQDIYQRRYSEGYRKGALMWFLIGAVAAAIWSPMGCSPW